MVEPGQCHPIEVLLKGAELFQGPHHDGILRCLLAGTAHRIFWWSRGFLSRSVAARQGLGGE